MKLVTHQNIDPIKWNACLAKTPFAHFYGLYQYLTTICNWEAIIEEKNNEYVFVMPLPYKKKLGLKYLYQPFFCQQLGVFGTITEFQEQESLVIIRKKFLFGSINCCRKLSDNKSFTFVDQPNFVLDLNKGFEDLKQNFNSNRKRTLKKCLQLETLISLKNEKSDIDETVNQFRVTLGGLFPEIGETDYRRLKKGLASISKYARVEVSNLIYAKTIVAAVLTVEYNDRIVYLLGYVKDEHRKSGMNALLFEEIIKSNALQKKFLDFEGSKNAGIAKFYQSFGAVNTAYVQMTLRENINEILKIVR